MEYLLIALFFILACYFFIQLKIKKENGKNLENRIVLAKQELETLTNESNLKKEELEKVKIKLINTTLELNHLIELEEKEKELYKNVDELEKNKIELQEKIKNNENDKIALQNDVKELKKELSIYKNEIDLIDFGFFEEPEYLFETSERFKEEIKSVREEQKQLIIQNEAVEIPDYIALIDDDKLATKIMKNQAKLMIKAFNIECDNLFSILKTSNYPIILEKIEKLAKEIEDLCISAKCGFSNDYIELKFEECELQYQFKLKQQREKEEQDMIKEQMREEQKAIKDYQKAILKAERDEEVYKEALQRIKEELEFSNNEEKEKLENKIKILELKLKEAEENSQRAKSMAEQTKRGHVYIISNIGSFGENVYKIGLTRRLDPLERVNELSNASVPFPFEVHAVIYSENAPELERRLHKVFDKKRVNMVNLRKEFFNVDLLEIKEEVSKIVDQEIDFKITALAEDYYESLKIKKMSKE